ncbi:hypothetical protein IMZ48_16445 [Candidatus Bathyarchaeota archaeon]|nr:hypothetical protein [Candidatus Bathyarchaeota archaeon]
MLMKAGQTFNVAVKQAVEDWAEQKLQGNELKKTISNWGRDGGGGKERDDELRAAHGNTFDLRCQLQTQKERIENIQYEALCIVNEFEKLRTLEGRDEAYGKGVLELYKVYDRPPLSEHDPRHLIQAVSFILDSLANQHPPYRNSTPR